MDWLATLDFDRALKNVETDILGDWFRDPWQWRELKWLVPRHLAEHAVPRLNATGVKRAAALDVPKENFAVRPAVVLDPLDRLLYQALVDVLSVRLNGDLVPWAYGWRLPRKAPKKGRYASNESEWDLFRDHLARSASYDFAALTTDVVSFFASIPVDSLTEQIVAIGGNRPAERLADMVSAWYVGTGRGLPQRSAASAALAHFYLRPLDDVIARFNAIPKGGRKRIPEGRALRWMDDIWLFGRTVAPLREAQIALQAAMRELGLEMNIGKTTVLRGEEMSEAVFQFEHSAVDAGLNDDDPDMQPFNDLLEKVIAHPEVVDRTTLRFLTVRMRDNELYERLDEIADATARMPHVADHLARLYRDSEYWKELEEWYPAYGRRWRKRLPWSVGQFGTMFPSSGVVSDDVHEFFVEVVETPGTPLPLLAVAAQRLAAWVPADARPILRAAADSESHPLARRIIGLAALHAGEVKTVVRRILQQHEENALVLAMLEDTGFKKSAVPVSTDFAG
jgi:Reverse transcriptase (RNA-dependent DNA polymerase)